MSSQKTSKITLILCVLAAVLYSSWPLGYWLNTQTAHYGLASDLEKIGQPYYWVFIVGDILSGLCVLALCALLWFKLRPGFEPKTWKAMCIGLLVFGLFTAVGTIMPSQCSSTPILRCGIDGDQGIGLDGLFSTIAMSGLFLGLTGAAMLGVRRKTSIALAWASQVLLASWTVSGILFIVFAIIPTTGMQAHFLQQIFLSLSGLAIIAIGINTSSVLQPKPSKH